MHARRAVVAARGVGALNAPQRRQRCRGGGHLDHIQRVAPQTVAGFEQEREDFFFLERSLEDFGKLMEVFSETDEDESRAILARAEEITRALAAGVGCAPADYRFQSACRVNLLRKSGADSPRMR